jgi:hypothetical protein
MEIGLRVIQKMILLTILVFAVLWGSAQSNLVFYNSNVQFNSPGFNPAFLTNQEKFTFSIFPLSGMSVGYNNQDVVKGMLKDILSGNFNEYKRNEVFKSLLKQDVFCQRFETPLLHFGYHSAIGALSFRITEVEQLRSGLKGDFSLFITDPGFLTIQLNQPQRLYSNAAHYREYSLGYARDFIEKKLSIGIRAKIYFGKSSLFSESQAQAIGNNGNYFLQTNGALKMSLPMNFDWNPKDSIISGVTLPENFSPIKYLFNSKNLGTGIDLGVTYKVNQKMLLSASVVDFGKIKWDSNLNTLKLKGNYEVLPKYTAESGDNYITKDPSFSTDEKSFNQLFKSVIDTTKAYTTTLPTSFFVGLQYQYNTRLNIGLVDRYTQSKGMSQNSFSLTANYEVNKKLSLVSGYSAIGKSYNNIPFNLIYNWGSGQTYIGTDNLLAFILSSSADYAGISIGTCFYLFKPKTKYVQSEYLPFYKEKKHNIFNN